MRWRWMKRAPKIAALIVVVLAALGFAVMMLWNWLVPALFRGPTIGFWQAMGLLVLSRILVGGLRGRPMRHDHWRHRMRERWQHMTPEERNRLRDFYGRRRGGDQHPKEPGP